VIMLTRRVSRPNGEFLGIVAGVAELRYFGDFYQAISTEGESVSLFRRDGTILARYPRVGKMIGEKNSSQSRGTRQSRPAAAPIGRQAT